MIKRGHLYKAGRIWGDINAVKRGLIIRRVMRRRAGRYSGRGLGKMFN